MNTIQETQEKMINQSVKQLKINKILIYLLIAGLISLIVSFFIDNGKTQQVFQAGCGILVGVSVMALFSTRSAYKRNVDIEDFEEWEDEIQNAVIFVQEFSGENVANFKKIAYMSCLRIHGASSEEFKNHEYREVYLNFVMEFMEKNTDLTNDEAHNMLNYAINELVTKSPRFMK